jgi:hypothetical protein
MSDQRVLLIDVDSKIPNLALMKLSSWHKSQGDQVGFNITEPDKIYASVVFKKNAHKLDGLRFFYPDAEIVTGGSGIDLKTTLPEQIEQLKPNYELYPQMDYSLGFTTRGCIRNCYFCVVPNKEGKITRWQHPEQFHDPRFDTIQLLDNNWMADREWFFETSSWIINHDLKLIENGLDIRLLDSELAEQISKFKMAKPLKFAFDSDKDRQPVLDGLKLLKNPGVNVRQNVQFYVYVHDDSQYESGVERCRILKAQGTNPFVMFNIDNKRSSRIKTLQRWANRKWLFWAMDIDQYGVVA